MSEISEAIAAADPSARSVEMIERAIMSLEKQLTIRLDGLERAQSEFQNNMQRVPTEVQRSTSALEAVVDQKIGVLAERLNTQNVKFDAIQGQFIERDVRAKESSTAASTAITAALQAQKEAAGEQTKSSAAAIAKSEANTSELIKAQSGLLTSVTASFDGKISDVKDRIATISDRTNSIESRGSGQHSQRAEWVAFAAVAITIVSAMFVMFGGDRGDRGGGRSKPEGIYVQPPATISKPPQ